LGFLFSQFGTKYVKIHQIEKSISFFKNILLFGVSIYENGEDTLRLFQIIYTLPI